MNTYELIDSGNGQKFERFGPYTLIRPASQAVWLPALSDQEWKKANALFTREEASGWVKEINTNKEWTVKVSDIVFKLNPTDFGHLGIFPEQKPFWEWIQKVTKPSMNILNLFAYSGGSTLAAAKTGAQVTHLDASKGMVTWAKENADLNHLENAPIRWIVDDALKFLKREVRRGTRYDGIILDPPSFGRGAKGEVFKIEEHLPPLLSLCRELLTPNPAYILLSCHTPGYTPTTLHHLLSQTTEGLKGSLDCGEMLLTGQNLSLPSGTFSRWSAA